MIDIAKNVVKNLSTLQNSGKSIENFYKTTTDMSCKKGNEVYEKESYSKIKDTKTIDMSDSVYVRPEGRDNEESVADQLMEYPSPAFSALSLMLQLHPLLSLQAGPHPIHHRK